MDSDNENELARRVIAAFPEAAATLEIAEALAEYLPIKSPDHLVKLLEERPVNVMGAKVGGRMLEGLLPEDSFPIETADDLATSVAAAVRVGSQVAIQRDVPIEEEALYELAKKLVPHSEAQGPVAMGWLGNDSLFGFKRAKGEGK